MIHRLPHAQIAHEGQGTQRVEQVDVIVVHPLRLVRFRKPKDDPSPLASPVVDLSDD
jgi:hypothetical protein